MASARSSIAADSSTSIEAFVASIIARIFITITTRTG
jgi:hypothetical protein